MTIAVDLRPETEKWLREEAVRRGKDAASLVAETIEEKRRRESDAGTAMPPHLGPVESDLLRKINEGLPESTWNRYRQLIKKRRAESLTEAEYEELLAVGNLIEETHVRRLEHVAQLARVRNAPFNQIMKELGIKPRRV
jgi:hypothetical protein